MLCEELIAFRNKYYHKTPEVTDQERKVKFVEAIKNMERTALSVEFLKMRVTLSLTLIQVFRCS